ncbi:PD40 domain-containing protein [bacterium]|nr:PD40 domain-containing protein [bacterium]
MRKVMVVLFLLFLAYSLWGEEIQLTDYASNHEYPQWSPDGNWIVYAMVDTAEAFNIYKVSAGGGDEIALTFDRFERYEYMAGNRQPQWSPDGSWIAYEGEEGMNDICTQVYKVPADGGDQVALTASYDYTHEKVQWSPDGNWISYETYSGGYWRLFKVPSAGGDISEITTPCFPYGSFSGQWSPDGEWLVYQRSYNIWKIRYDAGDEMNLTPSENSSDLPEWSPCGNWVTYQKRDTTSYLQIYKVSAEGGEEIALTFEHVDHYYPQWSPDGEWIAYMRHGPGESNQIYKVSPDETEPDEIQVTFSGYDCTYPQWSPDGYWVLYMRSDEHGSWQVFKTAAESGIKENAPIKPANISITVYPNPFNASCRISTPLNAKVEILDINGKRVSNIAGGDQTWEPSISAGTGVYFVRATLENEYCGLKKVIYLK